MSHSPDVVAECANRQGHHAEKHHDGAVHGAELVVELREENAPRRVLAKPPADERQGLAGVRVLSPDDQDERKPHQQEAQAGETVLQANVFVVGREKILT
jgi:hypothetical protein